MYAEGGKIRVRVARNECLGSFDTINEAKSALAKHFKVRPDELKRKIGKFDQKGRVGKYRYVYQMPSGKFWATIAGSHHLGTWDTENEAVEALAKHLDVDVKTLAKRRGKEESPKNARARFIALKKIFRKWRPNDITGSRKLGKQHVARLLACARPIVDVFPSSGWAKLSARKGYLGHDRGPIRAR